MLIPEDDPRFEIRRSTIVDAGNGLFATQPLAAGERLEVIGVLVRAESISDVCTRYADPYKFRVRDMLLIPLGHAGLVNHSTSPNMEKIIEGDRVFLRALRAIDPGEELLFTYSDYARDRFGLS